MTAPKSPSDQADHSAGTVMCGGPDRRRITLHYRWSRGHDILPVASEPRVEMAILGLRFVLS